MKMAIQMILVASVFLILYAGMHYFVISNIWNLANFAKNKWFYIFIIAMVVSFPLAMYLEKTLNNTLTSIFYTISAVWLGLIFFLFFLTLIYKILAIFININPLIALYSILGISLLLSAYSIIHANNLTIKNIDIPISDLKKEVKIVQITDLHLGTINRQKFLQKVVEKVNSLNPDFAVLTGDLVDGSAPIDENFIKPINKINAKTFFVIGNHEIYEGLDKIMPLLEKTNLTILRNTAIDYKNLTILGIDYMEGKKDPVETLNNLNISSKKPIILLYHSPTTKADILEKYNISLQLAGHTHGGQIFPFHLLSRLGNAYLSGLHSSYNNKTHVYVSEGTGTWGPPMRLGTNAEITAITLKKK